MSNEAPSSASSSAASQAASASTATAATTGATGSKAGGEEVTSSTTFSSIADLKNKSPKFWNLLMQSMAQNICIQINRANEHLRQAMKKNRDA